MAPIPYGDLPTGGGTWNNGGALTISGGAVTISNQFNVSKDGELLIDARRSSAGTSGIELGSNHASGGMFYVDLHIDNAADYNARLLRNTGTNGTLELRNVGTGAFQFGTNNTSTAQVTTAALAPVSSGGLTLGTSSLRWGNVYGQIHDVPRGTGTYYNAGSYSRMLELDQTLQGLGVASLALTNNALYSSGWKSIAGGPAFGFGTDQSNPGAYSFNISQYTAGANVALTWTEVARFSTTSASFLNALAFVQAADGNPGISPKDHLKQLSVGDKALGGYVLLNGSTYGTEKGDVLITGVNHSSAEGHIKMRVYDGTNTTVRSVFKADGTLEVGTPGGSVTGAGKINVDVDVYKDGTAYTNPDYVFETAYEGAPRRPAPAGYRMLPLAEVEQFTREYLHLPGISREPSGVFERADMLLEKVEELFLHAIAQEKRIQALEAQVREVEAENRALRAQPR